MPENPRNEAGKGAERAPEEVEMLKAIDELG
jgi:hypothetical protein